MSDLNADALALIVADYLNDRDDIASAVVVPVNPGSPVALVGAESLVEVTMQAGESYRVIIASVEADA